MLENNKKMSSEEKKRKLKEELSLIIDTLQTETRPVEDLMDTVGTLNAAFYWRFTNKAQVREALIAKINQLL
jgi:hypothetical protein